MYKYSETTDLIYPIIHLSRYKDLPDDLKDITPYDAQVHMGNIPPPEGTQRVKHLYPFKFEVIPQPSGDELCAQESLKEHQWVISEFNKVQVNLMYHWTGDIERIVATEQEWKDYAIALRNYTTTDENGNPVLVGKERPVAPV